MEKSSISNRSIKLFTLSSIKLASRSLLRKGPKDPISHAEMQLAADYWAAVCSHIPDWIAAEQRKVSSAELRQSCVHAHGVALHALGCAGADLMEQYPDCWLKRLAKLESIDWARSNAVVWEGRALQLGRLSKSRSNVTLTANHIRQVLGVRLSLQDLELEQQFKQ